MPNLSSLAGLEVTEKFVCGMFQVATMSDLSASCFELALGFDNYSLKLEFDTKGLLFLLSCYFTKTFCYSPYFEEDGRKGNFYFESLNVQIFARSWEVYIS